MGWDFLVQNRLDLRWQSERSCTLKGHRVVIPLRIDDAKSTISGLAPKSFQQHAQDGTEIKIEPVPPTYKKLLAEFPGIETPNFIDRPA